jgi:hypothetical protein
LLLSACGDDTATQHDAAVDTTISSIDAPASPWTMEYQGGNVTLAAIWGSGPTDIYVVGTKGTACLVLHSVGDGMWTEQTMGVSTVNGGLYAVWGSGAGDIYAGGFGNTMLHSTGNGVWTLQTIASVGPFSIWGSGPSDVYFAYANSGGNVYHSTGNGTWSPLMIGTSTSIIAALWGTSASNVYFVGGSGAGYHTPYVVHGPTSPTSQTMPAFTDGFQHDIFAVWGSSASDLYAVGNGPNVFHSDGGGTWTQQTSPMANQTFEDVWGSSASDVYIAAGMSGLFHSSGDGMWTADAFLHNRPKAIWGTSATDVYVVGESSIVHKKM